MEATVPTRGGHESLKLVRRENVYSGGCVQHIRIELKLEYVHDKLVTKSRDPILENAVSERVEHVDERHSHRTTMLDCATSQVGLFLGRELFAEQADNTSHATK